MLTLCTCVFRPGDSDIIDSVTDDEDLTIKHVNGRSTPPTSSPPDYTAAVELVSETAPPAVSTSCCSDLCLTWWDCVKDDMESQRLFQKDAQFRNKWKRRIKRQPANPGSPGKMAVKMVCACAVICVALTNTKITITLQSVMWQQFVAEVDWSCNIPVSIYCQNLL